MGSSASRAEERAPQPQPAHLRIHAVNVFVHDQDVSLRFFVDQLGFSLVGEEFGEERLVESLQRHREQPSRLLIASIVNEVNQFSPREQYDDRTLIIAKCR